MVDETVLGRRGNNFLWPSLFGPFLPVPFKYPPHLFTFRYSLIRKIKNVVCGIRNGVGQISAIFVPLGARILITLGPKASAYMFGNSFNLDFQHICDILLNMFKSGLIDFQIITILTYEERHIYLNLFINFIIFLTLFLYY